MNVERKKCDYIEEGWGRGVGGRHAGRIIYPMPTGQWGSGSAESLEEWAG